MKWSRCLLAIATVLVGVAALAGSAPAALAQSPTTVIELNFETTTGEPPADGLAVLDLNSGLEYRNDRVGDGDPIEVDGLVGTTSRLEIRRTDLQPGSVTCDGAVAEAVSGSGGAIVVITPDAEQVACTVTLLDELPATGLSTNLFGISILLLQAGVIMVGLSVTLRRN